ncbi:exopolysaccharide production repressor protein [Mesorhizobium sp.]|uniref:exopolysaccharide production repressor protein n=1 Tax=Mesorhizobium sp. TaxID=1871066 RepID=UPI00345B4DEB
MQQELARTALGVADPTNSTADRIPPRESGIRSCTLVCAVLLQAGYFGSVPLLVWLYRDRGFVRSL